MNDALTFFPPTRTAGLERLARFVPHAGRDYAARRNYDLGPGAHSGVSTLSPYLRHRLVLETEVLEAVLGRFAPSSAEKFIQEVYWRTYWKGWMEQRPGVWDQYQHGVRRAWDGLQTQSGQRARWEEACKGDTGVEAFDTWAQELVQTGYMHNHARMWFASIWIFTLELPWELGADFFLRHLLDGDPAVNTLSWRWVAGIQTKGKSYLARPSNIARYTEGRFSPVTGLAPAAPPLDGPAAPDWRPLPDAQGFDPAKRTGLIVHDDDLAPGWLLEAGLAPVATLPIHGWDGLSPLHMAPHVGQWRRAAIQDSLTRWTDRLGELAAPVASADAIAEWAAAHGLEQIVAPYAPVGPNADLLARYKGDIPLVQVRRDYDSTAWPHATHGFFRFKNKIPTLLEQIKPRKAA